MVFTSAEGEKFAGNFDHVCEGNYEIFVDNTTVKYGNDSSIDYAKAGYQVGAQHSRSVLLPTIKPSTLYLSILLACVMPDFR
jgi:hypothetical protein